MTTTIEEKSKLHTSENSKSFSKVYTENDQPHRIVVKVRYDDTCRNGHNSFSITGSIYNLKLSRKEPECCGCIHDEISIHFPELAHLIKWHLVSTDGPLHYLSNTTYHAGDLDYNALRAGEKRQLKNGKTGLPAWRRAIVDNLGNEVTPEQYIDSETQPIDTFKVVYLPWCREGEGKPRDLEAARNAAIWPGATDAELCLPKSELEKLLIARLPSLMEEFKTEIEKLGFQY